jgi:hypothetical protein
VALAFKEWTLICDALGSGRQILILRKGGIAEGRGGFSFQERRFYLFPTSFHEQISKMTLAEAALLPAPDPGIIRIAFHAVATHVFVLNNWAAVEALEPFHIWEPDVIRQRFAYRGKNEIHLALVRVSKLSPVWTLDDSPRLAAANHGLSWANLPRVSLLRRCSMIARTKLGLKKLSPRSLLTPRRLAS